ncbi:MAG: FHA domain-containing protein [Pseudomonadota bacterium]
MKLAFLNSDHQDFAVGKGSFSIGSTEQDDVMIGDDVAGHAILTVDKRGITLSVDDLPTNSVEVNGRSVQARAILRLGDRITIGRTDMILRGAEINTTTPPYPFEALDVDTNPARVVLRGLAGRYSGQIFGIDGTVTIGNSPEAEIRVDLPEDFTLEVGRAGERVYVRREAGDAVLDVNGHEVRHAELSPGDQIAVGEERLLVEAPGFVPGNAYSGDQQQESGNTQVFQAISLEEPKEEPAPAAEKPKPAPAPVQNPGSRLDAAIITVCVALSAAMLAWLYFNL